MTHATPHPLCPPCLDAALRPHHTQGYSWEGVLSVCGYPLAPLIFDFESFFSPEISLKKMSTVEYIMHPEGEQLGLSVYRPTQERDPYFLHPDQIPGFLAAFLPVERDYTWVAHNAAYDLAILNHLYDFRPSFVVDTLGLARAWNTRTDNSLDAIAKRENLSIRKGDTKQFDGVSHRTRWKIKKRGNRKIMPMPEQIPPMSPKVWQDLTVYANGDTRLEWEALQLYLPRLSRPVFELPLIQQTLEMYTQPTLEVDVELGEELVREMLAIPEKMISEMEAELEQDLAARGIVPTRKFLNSNKDFPAAILARIDELGEDRFTYTKQTKANNHAFAFAQGDESRELLLKHSDPFIRLLCECRVAADAWPKHAGRVKSIVAQYKALGKLGVPLKYHGAHTGRDSGDEGINLQNLGSRGAKLIKRVRHLLRAPEGYSLVIVDAAAIEARGVGWLADCDRLMDEFRRGEDVYCRFAESVLQKPPNSISKPTKDMDEATAKEMKWSRDGVGKTGMLGAGYGMGGDACERYAGGAITNDLAHTVIKTYRVRYEDIPKLWRALEDAFTTCFRTKQTIHAGHCDFMALGEKGVAIRLPSGRELKYHHVELRTQVNQWGKEVYKIKVRNENSRQWLFVWGGVLAENVTQAFARDIVFENGMNLIGVHGCRLVHRVHDELILLVKTEHAESLLAHAVDVMRKPPAWAPDMPLDAEGVVSTVYGDH